jgi:2-haloacid dehalogenase
LSDLPIIVFDVNETLLDLESLAPTFDRIFKDPAALRLWFAQLILYSNSLTLAGSYVPFSEIGAAVMKMLATTHGITISDTDRQELADKFATMPAHADVKSGLAKLRDEGFRLFTLTNNTAAVSSRQLEQAGIIDFFERRFCVDDGIRRYKPAPEAYAAVASALNLPLSRICLVACHVWDTLGAVGAGCEAALILRPGNALMEVGPQPHIIGCDLIEVADKLIARYKIRTEKT